MGIAQIGWTTHPPLFWTLAERFLCMNLDIFLNLTKQRKFKFGKPKVIETPKYKAPKKVLKKHVGEG